nr:hypothetical protein [Tanacetum cinerariifolium]
MFGISPDKVSREAKKVPNTVSASARTKPITVSQPSVITEKVMNSDLNGLSFTGVDNTKTRRPQPRSNTKNDRVPSASKSSRNKNKDAEVEEHHRNLLLFKNNKHISSACNNSNDAPTPPTTIPSTILENLPTFNSVFRFDERLRSLETTFSEYRQTNPFVDDVSAIPGIVHQYMTQQMMEAIREAVQIQTDRLQDSLQQENDEFLRNIDENMKKIIKGQVKSQVKEQVLRILPRIEESVNATLEAEVLTRSSHSSRTSYDIAADLSEMELKKILHSEAKTKG